MGQGQAEVAMTLLHECSQSGEWLCLKNLHLVMAWLPVLEKVFKILESESINRMKLQQERYDFLFQV